MTSPGRWPVAAASRRCGGQPPVVGGAHEHRQDGQPLAGALVHPGLAVLAFLGRLISAPLIGQGAAHTAQRAGILDGPLRDVEVEAPARASVRPWRSGGGRHLDPLAGRVGHGALLVGQLLLPGPDDLRWEAQGVDARRKGFDAGPEQPRQGARDRVEAGEVQRRLAARADSRRSGRGSAVHCSRYRSTSSSISASRRPGRTRGWCAARRRGRCPGRAAAGRSRPSSARRGHAPDAWVSTSSTQSPTVIIGDACRPCRPSASRSGSPRSWRRPASRPARPRPTARSRANPSGSRICAITEARYRWVRVSIHGRPGRMTSPQISISSPDARSVAS